VFCQLEVLRHCLPSSVRRTLEELPESLDETYERLLKGIKKANRDDARRLLQCLVVAIRPLRVEELAEILAIDFDGIEGIPKLNPDWRWEDQERALLAACSNLITIVDAYSSRVVQFSHFSVKEFLTSNRLATTNKDVSHYHILLEPAHTILAQACLGVLLQWDGRVDKDDMKKKSPLANYAARWWVDHAQFESVSSHVQKAMEYLFDPGKPHFRNWFRLHNVESPYKTNPAFHPFSLAGRHSPPSFLLSGPDATPLYYAAFCGFHDLTEHLVVNHPQHVNIRGGQYLTPLVAALAGNHFEIAQLLYEHGADVDVRGNWKRTLLYSASWHSEIVQWLLNHDADANTRDDNGDSPLEWAAWQGHVDVAQMLLEHNADAQAQNHHGYTPLHSASTSFASTADVIRLLLGHGVDVNARTKHHSTPLHLAVREGKFQVARLLLEHGANVEAKDGKGRTAFQLALEEGHDEVAELLLAYGATF
jgi:ankyrin repeat protein